MAACGNVPLPRPHSEAKHRHQHAEYEPIRTNPEREQQCPAMGRMNSRKPNISDAMPLRCPVQAPCQEHPVSKRVVNRASFRGAAPRRRMMGGGCLPVERVGPSIGS